MKKTQVQVPDELYYRAKALAKAKEWSLAEVFRRALENITATHKAPETAEKWELPKVPCGNKAPTTVEQLTSLIEEDQEDYLLSKIGSQR